MRDSGIHQQESSKSMPVSSSSVSRLQAERDVALSRVEDLEKELRSHKIQLEAAEKFACAALERVLLGAYEKADDGQVMPEASKNDDNDKMMMMMHQRSSSSNDVETDKENAHQDQLNSSFNCQHQHHHHQQHHQQQPRLHEHQHQHLDFKASIATSSVDEDDDDDNNCCCCHHMPPLPSSWQMSSLLPCEQTMIPFDNSIYFPCNTDRGGYETYREVYQQEPPSNWFSSSASSNEFNDDKNN
jgi:hypothetical protein